MENIGHVYRRREKSIRRRRGSVDQKGEYKKMQARSVKLMICIGIFFIAVLFKLAFPDTMERMSVRIQNSIDYKAVFISLGEGLSGEKKLSQALGEAYAYAFTGGVSSDETQEESDDTGETVVTDNPFYTLDTRENVQTDNVEKETDDVQQEADDVQQEADEESDTDLNDPVEEESDFSDAIVSAFLASQSEYADLEIPAGVTYDLMGLSFDYICPAMGTVSSPFGYRMHPVDNVVKFHYGTDIAADSGTTILSFADGTVLSVGDSTSFGNYLIIEHSDGVKSKYAHCSEIIVESGQTVTKGEQIATMGDTGNATASCLHFEVTIDGIYVNPEYYVSWT